MIDVQVLKNETFSAVETLPKTATEKSTGYDLIATSGPEFVGKIANPDRKDGELVQYHSINYIQYKTNLRVSIRQRTGSAVKFDILAMPRSSVSKYNLLLANSVGLIDNDYRGEILVRFKYVWQPEDFVISKGNVIVGIPNYDKIYKQGDAICQLKFTQVIDAQFQLVDDLDATVRGEGGFGHTDEIKKEVNDIVSRYKAAVTARDNPNQVRYETRLNRQPHNLNVFSKII